MTNGAQVEALPTKDGKVVGRPEGSWDVDRAEQARRSAVGEARVTVQDPTGGDPWGAPKPPGLPDPPNANPPKPPPLQNTDEITKAVREIRPRMDAEEARVFGPSGPDVWRAVGPVGPPFFIDIPNSVGPLLKDRAFLHGHPLGGPMSLFDFKNDGDLATAIMFDVREMLSTGIFQGRGVLSRVSRPDAGWPDLTSASLATVGYRVALADSEWAVRWRAWLSEIADPEIRSRAQARYDTEFGWLLARFVSARLGLPYEIMESQ